MYFFFISPVYTDILRDDYVIIISQLVTHIKLSNFYINNHDPNDNDINKNVNQ